ncbi:hypothetical protein L873DRAFT_1272267 [Choiromyces venosus 120613-1]|uniref:Uncharacterized protein n=1 Tax=Choiromyces venosus 120613-1 TaxID=1336337 RepID=A0A3N4K1Y9_9PEZI|nr:hypothetical protein L873DRAFT_1272267 [Choiromyces venosus 120613-1]
MIGRVGCSRGVPHPHLFSHHSPAKHVCCYSSLLLFFPLLQQPSPSPSTSLLLANRLYASKIKNITSTTHHQISCKNSNNWTSRYDVQNPLSRMGGGAITLQKQTPSAPA